jgi:hypothetical protein
MKLLRAMPLALVHMSVACLAPAVAMGGETRLDWKYRKIELQPSGIIRVVLPTTAERTEYVFGVRAEETAGATFVVGEAILAPPTAGAGLRLVRSLDDLPAHLVKVEGSTLKVLGSSVRGSALIIYGAVAPGARVELVSDEGTIASAKLTRGGSLLVRDGAVVPERLLGVRTLVMTLIKPGTAVNEFSVKPLLDGRYFAPVGALQRNLVTIVKPALDGVSGCCEQMARLRIHIDPMGNVTSVQAVGAGSWLSPLERAVRSWKFRPFIVNGVAVAVEGIIPFYITRDGVVSSPLLPSELP